MNIIVALKVVPDDQDITAAADGSLDMSKAHQIVSAYDLNAIEAAAQLAEAQGDSSVKAVTVGGAAIDDSKLKKNILARGVDELFMVADDAAAEFSTRMRPPRRWPRKSPLSGTTTSSSAVTALPITTRSRSTCSSPTSSACRA